MGKYEFRKFVEKTKQNLQLNQKQCFVDIYFVCKGCNHIGIKFRQPQQKEYGWKLQDFQCKIANTEIHQTGIQLQKWEKYCLSLKHSLKLKIKAVKSQQKQKVQIKQKDQQQSDDQPQITNQKLQNKLIKIYKSLCNALLKSQISQHQAVKDFCKESLKQKDEGSQNFEIFIVKKDKCKSADQQIGKLSIERLIHNPQTFYYQTECIEGKNANTLIEKYKSWDQENISYPRLLGRLMCYNQKKQILKKE